MTLNEISYAILNKLRPQISDDEEIDIREIKAEVHKQRALWLANELNKNRDIDDSIVSDLGCVDVEISDISECCDVELECDVIRTNLIMPKAIQLHDGPAIVRIGPIDKLNVNYSFIKLEQVPYALEARFNHDIIYAFLVNGRIWLISKHDKVKYLEKINIRIVAENPEDLRDFTNSCSGEACYNDDDEYPFPMRMLPYLEAEVRKQFMSTNTTLIDPSNDARGNIQNIQQQ